MLTLDYQSKDADGKVLLEKQVPLQDLSFKFETLKSDRFANKNGSLTKDDFATIKVGMPYLDLLNTVGIPDEIYASGLFRLRGSAFLYLSIIGFSNGSNPF